MLSNSDYRFKRRDNMYLIAKETVGFIWADECSSFMPWKNLNSYCMLRRTFDVTDNVSNAKIRVMADCKMCLYINGEYVKRSLYSGLNSARIYDEFDISTYIKKGKNVIAFLALHYGYDTVYGQSDEPGLLYQCQITTFNGEKIKINSDEKTKAKICDFYESKSAKISQNGGCVEIIDYRKYDKNWNTVDFDDSSWHNAKSNPVIFPSNSHTKRMADMLVEKTHSGKAIISACVIEKSHKELLIERVGDALDRCPFGNMYVVDLSCEVKPSEGDKLSCIVVKFAKERRGRILIDCNGFGGETVDVVYLKGFEDGKKEICGVTEFVLKPGENTLMPNFDDCIFDCAMLVIENHVQTLKINNVRMIADRYDFNDFMEFSSEDTFLSEMFRNIKTSIKNVYMCETIDYKGVEPVWELRDTRWQNLAYSVIAGDDIHFKRNIIKYAELINEKGYRKKIFSNNRSDMMVFDTMVWISSFGDLIDLTDETYLFERYINRIVSTLRWLTNFENQDGLLCLYKDSDECSFIVNCLYLNTIATVVKIAKRIDAVGEYTYYKTKHRNLLKFLKERFWNEERGAYCNSLITGQQSGDYSCDANAYAILYVHDKGERRIKTILESLFINQEINVSYKESFVKAMLKAGEIDIVIQELKKGIGAAAEGIFLVEGLLGVDIKNLKGSSINPYVKDNISYKAKLKTRFEVLELEVKNSKYKIKGK